MALPGSGSHGFSICAIARCKGARRDRFWGARAGQRMEHRTITDFLSLGRAALARGPVALIFAEDEVELASTIDHHRTQGFRHICLFLPTHVAPPPPAPDLTRVGLDTLNPNAVPEAVSAVANAAPEGTWIYWGHNAEYLYYPFAESRSVSEMLSFHAEERRAAMVAYVIDLYAGDLGQYPDGVARDQALFDRSGYYALARYRDGVALDRQLDIFGGIRWRYEEHIPWTRRRIDRVALFRAARGLTLRSDFTFSDEEMNTIFCPWHRNLTAAVASFRTAKALRANPGSRAAIGDFRWQGSAPFDWSSRQLLELGMIEPGQWF